MPRSFFPPASEQILNVTVNEGGQVNGKMLAQGLENKLENQICYHIFFFTTVTDSLTFLLKME